MSYDLNYIKVEIKKVRLVLDYLSQIEEFADLVNSTVILKTNRYFITTDSDSHFEFTTDHENYKLISILLSPDDVGNYLSQIEEFFNEHNGTLYGLVHAENDITQYFSVGSKPDGKTNGIFEFTMTFSGKGTKLYDAWNNALDELRQAIPEPSSWTFVSEESK